MFEKQIQIYHTYQLQPKMLESCCGKMGVYFSLVKAVDNFYCKRYFTKQYIFDCANVGGRFWVQFQWSQSSQFSLSLEEALSHDFCSTLYNYPNLRTRFQKRLVQLLMWSKVDGCLFFFELSQLFCTTFVQYCNTLKTLTDDGVFGPGTGK